MLLHVITRWHCRPIEMTGWRSFSFLRRKGVDQIDDSLVLIVLNSRQRTTQCLRNFQQAEALDSTLARSQLSSKELLDSQGD